MTADELKQITESVTAALAARSTAPTAPAGLAPAIMPLSSMQAPTAPTGGVTLSVGLEVPLGDGSTASVHMALPPGSEANLVATIEGLLRAGWPIRTYTPRSNTWGRPSWGQRPSYGRWGR